jgi:cytochrome c-type biogenesis protein
MSAVETVATGSLILAVPLAFAAGAVSFLSPCVLPLVPGYLSYVTGLTGAELAGRPRRRSAPRRRRPSATAR